MNEDLFTLFTSRFASAGIDAVVTGSVAAMLYGEPRLTHDIDLVVLLEDIRGIVRQQGEKLDRTQIEAKAAEHGLTDEWQQVGVG